MSEPQKAFQALQDAALKCAEAENLRRYSLAESREEKGSPKSSRQDVIRAHKDSGLLEVYKSAVGSVDNYAQTLLVNGFAGDLASAQKLAEEAFIQEAATSADHISFMRDSVKVRTLE